MNTSEYISSGILESYALGFCSQDEAAEVERMCLLHPEVKAELEEIQLSLNSYAASHTVVPKASVKSKIFAEIDALEQDEIKGSVRKNETGAQIIPMWKYLAAASIVLLALSIISNVVFYTRWKAANEQVIALNNEKNVLADNLKTNRVKLDEMGNNMAVMSDPAMTRVTMKGLPKSPESLAIIYWNKQNSEVYIDVKRLPEPTEGKQYQLWAIVDGKPVDAGMLPVEGIAGVLLKMKDFPSAQAFAITLEKAGGSASPTMEEMIVMGAI